MPCMCVQVIKANDDLTPEHHQFFLYQMLRGLKYIHSGELGQSTGPKGMRHCAKVAVSLPLRVGNLVGREAYYEP